MEKSENLKLEIASELIREFELYVIYEQIHKKEGAFYRPFPKNRVKKLILEVCKKRMPINLVSQKTINEILFFLECGNFVDEKLINPENQFCFKNGILTLIDDKIVFEDFGESVFTFQSDIEADLNHETDTICNFLNDILPNESDRKQVLESTAIGMWTDLRNKCNFDSFCVCYGSGSNGKSILFEKIIKPIFSHNAMASVRIADMQERFSKASLIGKRINVSTENRGAYIKEDDFLKAITSGDTITIERKNIDPFQISIFLSMFFCVNAQPNISDLTYAMERRTRLINFPVTFSDNPRNGERKADTDLKDSAHPKIKAMQKGLIVLLKETAERLCIERKTTPNNLKLLTDLQHDSSHHRQFVSDCIIFDSAFKIESVELFDSYVSWCAGQHLAEQNDKGTIKWVDPTQFDKVTKQANLLTSRLIKIYPSQIGKDRKENRRLVTGIKLKNSVSPVSQKTTDADDAQKEVNALKPQQALNIFGGKVI